MSCFAALVALIEYSLSRFSSHELNHVFFSMRFDERSSQPLFPLTYNPSVVILLLTVSWLCAGPRAVQGRSAYGQWPAPGPSQEAVRVHPVQRGLSQCQRV